jgi:hypothetical protein
VSFWANEVSVAYYDFSFGLVLSGFCCGVHYLRAMYMNSIPQDSSSNGKLFIYHHRKTMVIEDVGGKVDG